MIYEHYGLYQVQLNLGTGWFDLSVWKMEPRWLRHFLKYALSMSNMTPADESWEPDSMQVLRVKRIPYRFGLAQWEFLGDRHVQCCE